MRPARSPRRRTALAVAILLLMQCTVGLVATPQPTMAAGTTITWTERADFERNASTTGEETTRIQVDTVTSPGDVMLSGGVVEIVSGTYHVAGLRSDGSVIAIGEDEVWDSARLRTEFWTDVVGVVAGFDYTAGLRSDGTVVVATSSGTIDPSAWTNIKAVGGGFTWVLGVTAGGGAVASGFSAYPGVLDVGTWQDLVAITGGYRHTLGLKDDGKVLATGWNGSGQLNVSTWTDIKAIACGSDHSVGLKTDGTVVAAGDNEYGQLDVGGWEGIVAIAANGDHTLGLKSDGSVVAVGDSLGGGTDVGGWTDMASISTGWNFSVGMTKSETVVAVGEPLVVGDVPETLPSLMPEGAIGPFQHNVGLRADLGQESVLDVLEADFMALREGEAVKFAARISDDGVNWGPLLGTDGGAVDWSAGAGTYFGQSFGDVASRTSLAALPSSRYIDIVVLLEGYAGTSPVLHSVTLKWSSEPSATHTVTFLDWNGAVLKTQTVDHGTGATAPANPTRTGYHFTGWSPAAFSNITGDLTVTAQYAINTYAVTFNSNGGTSVPPQSVDHGSRATAPTPAPTKAGFTFDGWYADAGLTDAWDFGVDTVTGATALHAKWIAVLATHTVNFLDWNGAVLKTQTVAHGSPATAPANPTRTGYTFAGWSPNDFSTITGDLTVTAQYAPIPTGVEFIRYGGYDRYETAHDAATGFYPDGAKTAIIATGLLFPDALAASSLAGITDAPILLTRTPTLHPLTRQSLIELGASKVYIMGSVRAVSAAVEAEIRGIPGITSVVRLGGPTRYETALEIAKEVVRLGGSTTEMFLVRGDEFPDALSVSSVAAQKHIPILLTRPSALDGNAWSHVTSARVQRVYVAGSTVAVSKAAADAAKAAGASKIVRWGGANRYETGYQVINGAKGTWGISLANFGLATGVLFPDALTGGALMGREQGVLVLTRPDVLSATTEALLVANKPAIRKVVFFGSTRAVSAAVEARVRGILQ